jgi:hypothetical protein
MGICREFFIASFRLGNSNHPEARNANSNTKPLDPGLRRDDDFKANRPSNVIPAEAGIQRLCLKHWQRQMPHLCEI